jgi:ribosome-binding ATPase YchF (GTP1/OBG family)
MAELEEAEAREYLTSYGLEGGAVTRFLRAMHALLGLISFFTANESECRAWTVRCGTTAFEAAGEVHTDFQRGFIRAEVVEFEKLLSAGSFVEARNQGIVKLEGKESVLRDGDVVYFRHS